MAGGDLKKPSVESFLDDCYLSSVNTCVGGSCIKAETGRMSSDFRSLLQDLDYFPSLLISRGIMQAGNA